MMVVVKSSGAVVGTPEERNCRLHKARGMFWGQHYVAEDDCLGRYLHSYSSNSTAST